MASPSKQLLIGLPGTGKTTFLAALWHLVESCEVPTNLKLERLEGNREHLNRICEDWLQFRPMGRTAITPETLVSMRLVEQGGGESTEVFFPDISGELFNLQWKERRCSPAFFALARESAGVLLFVHPDTVRDPIRVDEVIPIVQDLQGGRPGGTDASEPTVPWDPDLAATQVKTVELLQLLVRAPFERRRLRLALVVSAWDLVTEQRISPAAWVGSRLPLLDQYLRANGDVYETRVFGVSAQGGDLSRDKERLQRQALPSGRIMVADGQTISHDLTLTVQWTMGKTG